MNVKNYILKKGFTPLTKMGLSKGSLSRWMKGEKEPSLIIRLGFEMLKRIDEGAKVPEWYEKELAQKVCTNCGCPNPKKTYDGYWCDLCDNEM